MVYWTLEFSQDVEVCDDKGHPAIAFFTTQAPSPNLTLRAEYVECDGSTMTFRWAQYATGV